MRLLALLLALAGQDSADDLLRRLGSDSIEERDAASQKLRALGEAVRPALERASKDPDSEVARRAAALLRRLALRGRLSPQLRAAIPGAELERSCSSTSRESPWATKTPGVTSRASGAGDSASGARIAIFTAPSSRSARPESRGRGPSTRRTSGGASSRSPRFQRENGSDSSNEACSLDR